MDDGKQDATTGSGRKQTGCMGCSWTFTIILALIPVIFVVIGMPLLTRLKERAKEADVKANLHNIQIAVERFAVDHNGQYPPYLSGGQGKYSEFSEGGELHFTKSNDCPDQSVLADPLLREGYRRSYNKNPFAGDNVAYHRFQVDVDDPLRNGTKEAAKHGTRFGNACILMGNVMADNQRVKFTISDSKGVELTFPTYADVEYPCSDMWKGKKPTAFLPGEFFYRSYSLPVIEKGVEREEVETYMLGAYGSIHTEGKDVIGPDPTDVNDVTPFGAAPNMYGNPNGIRDSIILVLTPGEDVPPKEPEA